MHIGVASYVIQVVHPAFKTLDPSLVFIAIWLYNQKKYKKSVWKDLEFSVLVGIVKKTFKQAAEMKHGLSECILIPTLALAKSRD